MASAARDHPLVAASSILACVVLLFSVGAELARAQARGATHATGSRPHGIERLWSEYPVRSKPAAAGYATRSNRPPAPAGGGSSSRALSPFVLTLVGVLGAAATLAAFFVARPHLALSASRSRPGPPRDRPFPLPEGLKMTDIVRRLFNKSDKQARESEAASAQVSDAAPMASGLRLI